MTVRTGRLVNRRGTHHTSKTAEQQEVRFVSYVVLNLPQGVAGILVLSLDRHNRVLIVVVGRRGAT